LGLNRGPEEEHSLVGKDWGCGRAEMRLEKREQEGGEWR